MFGGLVAAVGFVVAGGPPAAAADAVVAFHDTGINPYHEVFRDRSARAQEHPSTYLPGFPADAERLALSLDAPDLPSALRADCEIWRSVRQGRLYWIPGTRIVGAISFGPGRDFRGDCDGVGVTRAPNLDDYGHGTMVASRGAAAGYGACPECLIVSVQWGASLVEPPLGFQQGLRWMAAHRTWIDATSHSFGPAAPLPDPTDSTAALATTGFVRTVEMTAGVLTSFWAAGNGASNRGGGLGHPTLIQPHLTPSVVAVGGHDSGHVTTWPGFPPHLVADACDAWAADHTSMDRSDGRIANGTSSATPYVAGGTAEILREARRILGHTGTGVRDDVLASGPAGVVPDGPLADGVLTRAELRRLILVAGTERPRPQPEDFEPCLPGPFGPTPVMWSDVPEDAPEHLLIGYGALDRPAVARARAVLQGGPAPVRAEEDAFFAEHEARRRQLHEIFTGGEAEEPPPAVPPG